MHVVQSAYCYHKSSICLSVGLSVILMYHGCLSQVSSKVITRVLSSNIGNLVQGERHQNSCGIGVESLFSADNLQYLGNGAR